MSFVVFPQKYFSPKQIILSLILILVICSALYLPMLNNYYFADELDPLVAAQKFKIQLKTGEQSIFHIFDPNYIQIPGRFNTHYRPWGYVFAFLVYFFFGPQAVYLNLMAILAHLLIVYMLFFMLRRLFQNDVWALITTLLFATDGFASDAVFFVGAAQLYMPEAVPHYICLLTFTYWIFDKKPIFLILSCISAFFAVFANEFALTLLPIIMILYYMYEKNSNLRAFLKPRFFVFYLLFFVYLTIAIICQTNRVEVAFQESSLLSRLIKFNHIFRVPALIEQFFEKIPLVDLMVRKMPHLVFGTSIFIVLILLLIYSGIKNKDHRYRFLLLWLFCTTLILIPVYLKTRYLYHTAVPFWGMMVYLIALFLHYLKKFWTNLNLRVAGTVFFILMMASNVYLNRQREIMWENIGKFCYFRMERLLDRIGNPSQIIKIYYLKPVGMTERTFLMESKDFTNYLRVYYDDPAISYEGFSSSAELDKLNLSPGEYILTMEGKEKVKDFVPIIR